jgi:hypothetical protein
MKRFQWKWIFTWSKTCSTIWRPSWFAMVAILNPKWPPNYKKSSNLGKIWFPSRLWYCNLISIIWEPCYDPSDHIISCYYYYYNSQTKFVRHIVFALFLIIIIILIIPLFSSASILSGTFLGNCTVDPFQTWH